MVVVFNVGGGWGPQRERAAEARRLEAAAAALGARAEDTRLSSSSNMTAFSEIKVSTREMVKNKRNRVQRRARDHPSPPLEVQVCGGDAEPGR